MGPGVHIVHYPVANFSLTNIVAFVTDPHDWPVIEKRGPTVRKMIDLLPEQLDKWAVFDLHDHPPSTYARDRLCIAGDAAHGTSPHHTARVGIGIEGAYALSALLEVVVASSTTVESRKVRLKALAAAFQTFSKVRRERYQ